MNVFGLIGEKLSHSLSPIIHHYVYEILELEASYSLYQVQPHLLDAAVQGIRALDLRGVNVTIPYKVKIMGFLDYISPEAQKIGAVNTILNDASILKGYNTDYIGFGRLLDKHLIKPWGKRAVILGSGGAAKSVSAYLEDSGVSELYIVSRKPEEVNHFDKHEVISYEQLSLIEQGYLLINCTPIGMYPCENAIPIPQDEISKFENVVDLIYNPSCTLLMSTAINHGIPAYNGLYMLISQAIAAIEIWYRISIPKEIVDEVYKKLIQYMIKIG
ncbi:MAG: aroE2 [Clostridia bacterium]|jgi:shikimate dehydrogenase|nr:aroE2 [Clostridia bacterium]